MGAAKKKRDAAALAKAVATMDLGPLTNIEVRTAVLAHIVRTGKCDVVHAGHGTCKQTGLRSRCEWCKAVEAIERAR